MPNQTSMVPTKPLPANPQHLFCVFLSLSLSKHVPQLGGFAPKSSPSQQRAGQSHSSSSSSLGFPPKLTPNPGPAVSSTVQTGTAAPAGSELEKGVPFTYLGVLQLHLLLTGAPAPLPAQQQFLVCAQNGTVHTQCLKQTTSLGSFPFALYKTPHRGLNYKPNPSCISAVPCQTTYNEKQL